MVEPERKDNPPNLEDTVRNLREENAKLMQLLRSQGLILDASTSPNDSKSNESSNITFDHSDVSLTTNSINTTNQITHQHVNNHGPTNQQNYSGQTIHGNQANITPNFNTVIQTTSQPFVQNNSNTLVQNNTNLIQPINLVNFNNVNLDSLQSFLAAQNNLVYFSQPSSSSTTTTTVTTTTTTSSTLNLHNESEQHQVSIRPKPSTISPHQDLHSVVPKAKSEHFDYPSRQLSSSTANTETTNLLDNDSNHKQPRPIRPKPSSRINSLQYYGPVVHNETKPTTSNVLTPSLLTNANTSSTVSILSPPTSFEEHHLDLSPQLLQSKSMDLSIPPTNNLLTTTKKPTKNSSRNRKKPPVPAAIPPSTNPPLISIAPNPGRPLAPAPLNVQRIITTAVTNKRSTSNKKRNSKSLIQYHSESILQQSSSPPNSFADSISGLMQNFDQELIASNFLSQPPTTNILSNDTSNNNTNINLIRTLDHLDVRQIVSTSIQRTDSSYHSMPTIDDFNDRLDPDYTVDNEQITSFINDDEMNFAEMNFDENTFLKQFDLEDTQIKLNFHPEQSIFASLLTSNHSIEQSTPPLPPPPMYPGSSLINNNVFTTVVPLGAQQQSSLNNSFSSSRCLPEEGVQLTAKHLEPSQVATYESVKYQDILDDLVTVTDQDVLSHVQAAVAANETPDFSFALLEATNEIIKTTEIQPAEETASAFADLQYFYPIEQEQELLQKKLEQCKDEEEQEEDEEEEEEEEEEEVLHPPPAESPKSDEDPTITDLTSILQINQARSPSPIKEPTSITTDFETLLPPPPSPPRLPSPSPPRLPSPSPPRLPSPPPPVEIPPAVENNSRKACIIFEPILSPAPEELVLESGCVPDTSVEKPNSLDNHQIEDLLNDGTENQFEIVENQGHTSPSTSITVDNLDHLIEEIEEPTKKLLEKNFYHYQKVYHENLKKKPKEQYSPIPSVKLKLNSIYPKHKKKRKLSPSPAHLSENLRPPLKIKIRTKLPSPPPPPPPPIEELPPPIPKIKIRKPIKKAKRPKKSSPTIDEQLECEAKLSLKTEYAGLTRFEQPLAQLYHQPTSPDTPIPPTPGENDDTFLLPNKQDTPPTTLNCTSPLYATKKFSHLLNYDDEPLNNNTYITPPPEVDGNIHQQKTSHQIYQNPKKSKKSHPNTSHKKELHSSTRKPQVLPTPSPQPAIHMDPYAQPFHHFDPQTSPFFNFPFSNPFMNPHTTPTHFHQNSMKYHYPTHQQQFSYHPHLQRQQQYNNPNYMPSHGHHPYNR